MKALSLASLLILILVGCLLEAQTFEQMKKGKWAVRSSIRSVNTDSEHKVLIVVGDGAEVLDTMGPYYRLGEDYQVVIAAPEVDSYHLVIHELDVGWDITRERQGYRIESDIAFRDIDPDDYVAMVLPGGRAPEYLRYNEDLIRATKAFCRQNKPVASICHGIEILATSGVIAGKKVTTIPKCRFDATACGATFVTDPVVKDGNLLCARGKKDISPWMKSFVKMIEEHIGKR
jgi:protease I